MTDSTDVGGALARILPPLVLIVAFGSFVSLAIYAYKSGQSTTADGELLVIEADKSPMKEKPADPGGMEFPNQDKTIYETFSATGSTPPQVERVLPTPEEPIDKNADSEASSWINEKVSNGAVAENVFAPKPAEPKVISVTEELGKQAVAEAPAKTVEITKVPEETKKAAPVVVKEAVSKKPAATASTGKELAQLGAYRSEADARAEFAKIQKKHSVLTGLTPLINRADLGDKGVFYRLRIATSDAKKLCEKLSGQACMVVKQ